jgi:hypothetical protein
MPQKNYCCENTDSCSLMSVTCLNTSSNTCDSSSVKSCSSSLLDKSCSDSSKSLCDNHSSSKLLCPESSSLCPDSNSLCPDSNSLCPNSSSVCADSSSSCATYSDKTSCSNTDGSISCKPCDRKCDSDKCEKLDGKVCEKLVKKYNCSREELLAIADIIMMLNFIKSKLTAVKPNVLLRRTEKYLVHENIAWLESFVDTLFCVLRKNEAYKIIKVKECKLKNDSDEFTSNRTYLLKVKYNTKKGCVTRNIPITFQWSQLTNNQSAAYNSVLDLTIRQITNEITVLDAASVVPFLHNK